MKKSKKRSLNNCNQIIPTVYYNCFVGDITFEKKNSY